LKETGSKAVARFEASGAFRSALPLLVGDKNIHDFIACVAYGYASGIVYQENIGKLLYAAQVAFNVSPARAKKSGNAPKSLDKCIASKPLAPNLLPPPPFDQSTDNKGITLAAPPE
jgi:hypothetical protein